MNTKIFFLKNWFFNKELLNNFLRISFVINFLDYKKYMRGIEYRDYFWTHVQLIYLITSIIYTADLCSII